MDQNKVDDRQKNWSNILFVEYPHLFLPELENQQSQSESEVNGLCRVFDEFRIGTRSRILDLSCGIGRHAISLAKRGYQVVGYDPSRYFLEKARQHVKYELLGNTQENIRFYEGEINRVAEVLSDKSEGNFNAIISMFNSLGYTKTEEDLKLFKDILGLATPGGILVTETENRDWRIRNFLPYVNYDYGKLQLNESWKFNLENSTAESISKYYEKDPTNNSLRLLLDIPTHMRLYSLHEMKEILNKSGWIFQKSYGSIQTLNSVTLDTPSIVTISINR
jgi:SAM-dependent methyltransferase